MAEDAVLGSHLLIKLGPWHRGQDQDKGSLEPVLHGKVDNLIEDLWRVIVETYHKGAHDADLSFVKTSDRIGILSSTVGRLAHSIDVRLRK